MSGSKAKFYRKMIRKEKDKVIDSFIDQIKDYDFLSRIKIAWYIAKGKK
jgi:hypothetical protein